MKKFGWLFIGSGGICRRVMANFGVLSDTRLAAVYSRTFANAQKLASDHGAIAYETFDEAIADENVDAVYIATPHPMHMEFAIKAMKAGKPVLCEKPAAPNLAQVKKMVEVAKEMDVYYMEGMWTRFNPVIRDVVKCLESGKLGKIHHIDINFGYAGNYDPKSRLYAPELAGGALLDVGIYAIAFAQMVTKTAPNKILSSAKLAPTGVDANCSMLFEYPEDITASIYCAINTSTKQNAVIYGENGHIEVDVFWEPHRAVLNINGEEPYEFTSDFEGEGYNFEFQYVQDEILAGKKECELYNISETLLIIEMMDEIRAQNDIVYPFDKE